jgi:hypothetical protein
LKKQVQEQALNHRSKSSLLKDIMKTTKMFLTATLAIILSSGALWANNNDRSFVHEAKPHLDSAQVEPNYSFMENQALSIPVTVVYDHFLIVQVTINGEKLNFLFDESALYTAISKEKADLLSVDDSTLLFIGHQSFGGNMKVSDFSKLKSSGLDVDGIIGSSIVDYYNINLDLAQGKVICTPY